MDDISPFDHLSVFSSVSICLTFSVAYVLALYVLSPSKQRYERNHSNVICRRLLAVFIICSLIYLFLIHTCNPNIDINLWLGFRTNISSVWTLFFFPCLLTLMLYTGPIVQWLVLSDWRYSKAHWNYYLSHWSINERLIFIRNYLAAPFTEGKVIQRSHESHRTQS
jgi:succinate dehydrogenase hydrophobic anchor subunit